MKVKKVVFILLFAFSNLVYGADLAANQDGVNLSTNEQDSAIKAALGLSYSLLGATMQLSNTATKNNELSQASMLQLSQDIGTMADRINTMADKIVATQNIQSVNLQATERNMLQAQENLLGLSKSIDNAEIEKNIQKAQTTLQSALAKEKVNIEISKAKSIDAMISKMNQTSYKYRYKYMNAIKASINKMSKQVREEEFKNVVATIQNVKNSTQKDMQSESVSSVSTSISSQMDSAGIDSMGMDSADGMDSAGGMGGGSSGGPGGGAF